MDFRIHGPNVIVISKTRQVARVPLTSFFFWAYRVATTEQELLAKKRQLDRQIQYHTNELTKKISEKMEILETLAAHKLRNISDLRTYLGKQDPPP
jgi:hypothetical protein